MHAFDLAIYVILNVHLMKSLHCVLFIFYLAEFNKMEMHDTAKKILQRRSEISKVYNYL